jgi:hypothetical protein
VKLPGKENSNFHGAMLVYLNNLDECEMIKWIHTVRFSIENFLYRSLHLTDPSGSQNDPSLLQGYLAHEKEPVPLGPP